MAFKFTCDRCTEEFNPGSWECKDGTRHTVPSKTYYVPSEGLQGFYGAVSGTEVQSKMRKTFNFTRGTLVTADPELQEHLDKYGECTTFENWRKTHVPAAELEAENKRKASRLEQTNNDLLEEVKRLKEQVAAGAQPILVASGKGK